LSSKFKVQRGKWRGGLTRFNEEAVKKGRNRRAKRDMTQRIAEKCVDF